jgi:outer membrane lipoprotein-sorting protein
LTVGALGLRSAYIIMKRLSLYALILFGIFNSLLAVKVDELITLARSQIADEDDLEDVETLQFYGVMEDKKMGQSGKVEFKFKKPYKYFNSVKLGENQYITATNGNEGYRKNINIISKKEDFIILYAPKVKQLIVTASEKLYFMQGVKKRHGEVIDKGLSKILNRTAYQLDFQYPGGATYQKYFDPKTFDLIATVTSDDGKATIIVEEEHKKVEDIRFATKVSAYDMENNLLYTITFQDIKVNEDLNDDVFNIPMGSAGK